MHELWYDYIKPNYGDRAKLCYTDTNNLVIYIETEDFYGDIANNVEKWFDTSNFDENDQGDKQVEALKDLKPIEGKSNNQSNTSYIFNNPINERKSTMNKLYESVDMNKLYFKYEGNIRDVSFYEYMDSKESFDKTKNNQIKFDDALKTFS